MDHTRDNPLKRFAAFWIAALLLVCFAIACFLLRPLTHSKVDTAYEATSEARVALVSEARSAQDAALASAKIDKVIEEQAKLLHTQDPKPGSKPLVAAAPAEAPTEEAPTEDKKTAPAE